MSAHGRSSSPPQPSLKKLLQQGVCPDCGSSDLLEVPTPDGNGSEVVCSNCGCVLSSPHSIKVPTWLPHHSPISHLSFGNSLGNTLNNRDAKKILEKTSRNEEERRLAYFRALQANAMFSKETPVESSEVRKMKMIGKKLSQKFGLDEENKANDPMDLSHILGNDYGLNLRKVGLYLHGLKKHRIKLDLDYNSIAQATLFQTLMKHDPRLVDKYKKKWNFGHGDLGLVKRILHS